MWVSVSRRIVVAPVSVAAVGTADDVERIRRPAAVLASLHGLARGATRGTVPQPARAPRADEDVRCELRQGSSTGTVLSVRIAYLTGRYPEISHTFILREVRALRGRGL